MAVIAIDAKQVQKRSTIAGVVPTIPVSDDHTDGTWNATDIYSGEFFINEADGKVFIRIANDIYEFGVKPDKFVVAGGGEDVFTTSKNILSGAQVFEDGTLTLKTVTITGVNKVTLSGLVPEGTTVEIYY